MSMMELMAVAAATALVVLSSIALGVVIAEHGNKGKFDAYRLGRKDEKYGFTK